MTRSINETQSNKIVKPRVVVCSAEGLHAGDLAALLVQDFHVERAMTLPGLIQALGRRTDALVIFRDTSSFCQPHLQEVITQIKKWNTRVLVFGSNHDFPWEKHMDQVQTFSDVPHCQVILKALEGLVKPKTEATETG